MTWFSHESYVLAQSTVDWPQGAEGDLLTGVEL